MLSLSLTSAAKRALPALALTSAALLAPQHAFADCPKPDFGLGYRQTQEQYPFISCYHRGLSKVLTGSGERLYIDESGKTVLTVPSNINQFCGTRNEPRTCWEDNRDIDFFLDYGLVLITQGENGGIANKNGKIIVPPKKPYPIITSWNITTVFKKEHTILADVHQGPIVSTGPGAGRNYSIYDFNGNILSKFTVPDAHSDQEEAKEGLIRIINDEGMAGYINAKGQTVVPPLRKDVGGTVKHSGEGMIQVSDPDNNKFCGFVDKTGALVIPYEYDCVGTHFRDGVVEVRQGNERFYINKQGQRVEDPGW